MDAVCTLSRLTSMLLDMIHVCTHFMSLVLRRLCLQVGTYLHVNMQGPAPGHGRGSFERSRACSHDCTVVHLHAQFNPSCFYSPAI